MPLSYFDKVKITTLASDGMSCGQIAERLGVPKSTAAFIVQKWQRTGTVARQPGSGRRRISTPDEDRAVVEVVENSPFATAVLAVNETNFPGNVRTARRRINDSGLRSHVAARKIGLTQKHREARMGFALEHLIRDEAYWRQVVFSDEKVFQSSPNGRLKVYRPRNTRFHPQYVQNTQHSGRFAVNMWAWISANSPGVMIHVEDRLNSDAYIRILENVMVPSVQAVLPNGFVFQQDNCSIHTARRVKTWFENHNIDVLDWPSRSPDLNPIENMWGLLVKKLEQQRLTFHNRDELLAAISDTWHSLPQDYHRNLCLSMSTRLRKVLDVNGAMTKY